MLRKTALSTLALGLFAVCPRLAHAQDCELDTDCPGYQVCVDLSCGASTEPLDACEDASDCSIGDCVDGFCKQSSVQCEAEDGSHCKVGVNELECLCAGGVGFGEGGGFPGEGEPPPEPDPEGQYAQCLDSLTMCEEIGDGDGDEPDDPGDEPLPGDGDGDGDGDGEKGDGGGETGGDQDGADLGDDMVVERGCSVGGASGGPTGLALGLLGLMGLIRRTGGPRRHGRADR